MFDRGFFLTLQSIRRQLAAMPNDLYFIGLIHQSTHTAYPGERLWTAGQLLRGSVVRFLRARNCEGFDVYLLPYAEESNAGYILLDLDHPTPSIVSTMQAQGHQPCVILQTSPGHLQAWVRISPTPLEPALASAVGRQLARTYQGDLASTDWRHLGRLAGFTNQKRARRTPSGYPPWVKVIAAEAVLASAAEDLLHSARRWLAQAAPSTPGVAHPAPSSRVATPCPTMTVQGAASVYQRWLQRWHIHERFPRPDWSIVDLWLARKLLAQHTPPAQVGEILRLGSPDFPRQHGNPEDYLRRTLARAAFPPPTPPPVCSCHATAPARPSDDADTNSSNSAGGR